MAMTEAEFKAKLKTEELEESAFAYLSDFDATLGTWIEAAKKKEPDDEGAQIRWVVWRALQSKADHINSQFAELDADDMGSRRLIQQQFSYWTKRRDGAKDKYERSSETDDAPATAGAFASTM